MHLPIRRLRSESQCGESAAVMGAEAAEVDARPRNGFPRWMERFDKATRACVQAGTMLEAEQGR